jgi:hypothetical protein
MALFLARECDQLVAVIQLQAHRLLQEHVAAGLKCSLGRLVMQVRRQHKVHRIQFLLPQHLAVIFV